MKKPGKPHYPNVEQLERALERSLYPLRYWSAKLKFYEWKSRETHDAQNAPLRER